MEILMPYLPYLIPILLLQLCAQILSLVNLFRKDTRVRWGNKTIWAMILILGEFIGVLIYLIAGRLPDTSEDD